MLRTIGKILLITVLLFIIVFAYLSIRVVPKHITYGVSFSKLHANELGLDWKETYRAILDDLGVRHFRLSAHWTEIEPTRNRFNFTDFDYQIREAEKRGAEVILSVGRRLPGWPECHNPSWIEGLPHEEMEKEVMEYIEATVKRYKDSPAVKYWQVENEAFLTGYVKHHCGEFLDEALLQREIALVRKLDPTRKIIITDSGELGLWYKAYRNADIFATSIYLYINNQKLGHIRYPMTPGFFRAKTNLMNLVYGRKESILSELSAEPWLLKPIIETPIEEQLEFMNIEKFNESIKFAKKTGFSKQLLWGAEWWYYLKKNNHPELWERAQEIFGSKK